MGRPKPWRSAIGNTDLAAFFSALPQPGLSASVDAFCVGSFVLIKLSVHSTSYHANIYISGAAFLLSLRPGKTPMATLSSSRICLAPPFGGVHSHPRFGAHLHRRFRRGRRGGKQGSS
jgi:hypothetical protein